MRALFDADSVRLIVRVSLTLSIRCEVGSGKKMLIRANRIDP